MSFCCINCFQDQEIIGFINSQGTEHTCDFCGSSSTAIEIDELADFISPIFTIYEPSSEMSLRLYDYIQSDWSLFSDTAHGGDLVNQLLSILEIELNSSSTVKHIDFVYEGVRAWTEFKKTIKGQKRFLHNTADFIDSTDALLVKLENSLSRSTNLYRARIHHNLNDTRPFSSDKMGVPPQMLSTEGRANPKGIPYLYLPKEIKTTLYEVRGSYLDFISIGTFRLKPGEVLNILDLSINKRTSPFYSEDIKTFTKQLLLANQISEDLSKPLHRYDSELEYIPTQFICEYARYNLNADGVQYKSSLHQGGINIVIFNYDKLECTGVELNQISEIKLSSISV